MFTISQSLSRPAVRNPGNDDAFNASVADRVTVITPGVETQEVHDDVRDTIQSDPVILHEAQLLVDAGLPSVSFESLNPSVATVDSRGYIQRVSDGLARILVQAGRITKRIDVELSQNQPSSQIVSSEFIDGSLGKHCSDYIESQLAGKTMEQNGDVYANQDHTNGIYVRNPFLWCGAVDLTCASPWNSHDGRRRAGTLFTKRHILLNRHYPLFPGVDLRFVTNHNEVVTRTIIGGAINPATVVNSFYPDIQVCTLNADLPPAIRPCRLFPADISDYLVNLDRGRMPALALTQFEKASCVDLRNLDPTFQGKYYADFLWPEQADRARFYDPVVAGDSGNPVFGIVNTGSGPEAVLLSSWSGPLGGANYSQFIDEINTMIAEADSKAGVSTGYTVTTADLSNFTNYSS